MKGQDSRATAGWGSPWLKELYEYYAPVRQEAIDKGYTEEEINRAIDQAVAEVRNGLVQPGLYQAR